MFGKCSYCVGHMQSKSCKKQAKFRKPVATRMASSDNRRPTAVRGDACSQSPACGVVTAFNRACDDWCAPCALDVFGRFNGLVSFQVALALLTSLLIGAPHARWMCLDASMDSFVSKLPLRCSHPCPRHQRVTKILNILDIRTPLPIFQVHRKV